MVLVLVLAAVAWFAFRPLGAPNVHNPPALQAEEAYVAHVIRRTVPGPPAELRTWMEANPIVEFMVTSPEFPGIVDLEVLSGEFNEDVGATRRVTLEDGHMVVERITQADWPYVFAYQIWNPTAPRARVVSQIWATQEFLEVDGGDAMTCIYRLMPALGIFQLPLKGFLEGSLAPGSTP